MGINLERDKDKFQKKLNEFKERFPERDKAKENAQVCFEELEREFVCSRSEIVDVIFDLIEEQKSNSDDGTSGFWLLWNGSPCAQEYYNGRDKIFKFAALLSTTYWKKEDKKPISKNVIKNASPDEKQQVYSFLRDIVSNTFKKEIIKQKKELTSPKVDYSAKKEKDVPSLSQETDCITEKTGTALVTNSYVIESSNLLTLLASAEEQQDNISFLEKIHTLVQNVEDDFLICYYLNQLTKSKNKIGFYVLMDAMVNVSGEEKVADVAKMILASAYDTEELKSMYTECVAYISTEKVKSQFNFGDFMDTFLKDPINRETRNFLSDICERVSEIGREGCKQVRKAQNDLAESKAKNTDTIIYTIGDSVSDLENCIINMRASEEISVRNAAGELIDKIEHIHAALSKCGIVPVTDVRDWAEQKIVAYDGELHDIQGELKPNRKVKLNSIGLKSKIGKAVRRAKARSVQGDNNQ